MTNYNIIVFDKAFKHNSSLTFINLSTIRAGSDYDANVSALLWDFYDKKNKWEYFGKYAESQIYGLPDIGNQLGHLHNFGISKVSGNFNFTYWQEGADNKYNQNDMGYFTNNNYFDNGLWLGYKWLKPKWYNNLYYNINLYYSRTYTPNEFQYFTFNTNLNGQLKNLWSAGINVDYSPEQNDFYESRIPGKVFKRPEYFGTGFWVSSNDAKKYSASVSYYYKHIGIINADGYDISFYQQVRFNKNLTISLTNNWSPRINYQGYAWLQNDSSYFGQRNINTVENILNLKYNFNNKMGVTAKIRHYWSSVKYDQYYALMNNGYLSSQVPVNFNADDNVNFFNVDLLYTWEFAPGSFIYLSWKNAGIKEER